MASNILRWYAIYTIPWTHERCEGLKRLLFSLTFRSWSYILDKLDALVSRDRDRDMTRDGDNSHDENAAEAALSAWKDFGIFVRLNEDNGPSLLRNTREHLLHSIETGPHPLPKPGGCCWAPCVCAGRKPYHHLRTCTGCNTYVYCGKKCQRL